MKVWLCGLEVMANVMLLENNGTKTWSKLQFENRSSAFFHENFLIGCTVGPMHMLYTNPRISIDYFRYYLELLVFMCFWTCTFANSIENHYTMAILGAIHFGSYI